MIDSAEPIDPDCSPHAGSQAPRLAPALTGPQKRIDENVTQITKTR